VNINLFAYITDINDSITDFYFDFFKYTEGKNLNAKINPYFILYKNSKNSLQSSIESSLKNFYDIFIYDSVHLNVFDPYLLDLRNYLPKEHIEMYDSRIINETCIYKEKLIGLVKIINNESLYILIIILDHNNNH